MPILPIPTGISGTGIVKYLFSAPFFVHDYLKKVLFQENNSFQ